ncbi:hypothetical protein ACFFX1_45290 [Dactylosporangium sucinum]|uniref:Uncharacterized protein n=1 Tax=Dactylosporangium sucinum TaxID=1424081 RepID=A0A917U0B1_9ACTN|nr:hypothetical protein [Dactylosporangium sucinum]GGM48181.1 hypothetical protein GCM10007977_057190 [Dactylosporangium sucinum]
MTGRLNTLTNTTLEHTMCRRATCNTCGKATYTGCGNHVDEVLAGVPAAQRCTCEPRRPASGLLAWLRRR